MSSLLKQTAQNTKVFPTVQFVGGPFYNNTVTAQKTLFPFTFAKGTLDIVPTSGLNITEAPTDQPLGISTASGFMVKQMGGSNLVQSIGANFKNYIFNCNWSPDGNNDPDYDVSSLSSIVVYLPGVVTKVQQLTTTNLSPYSNPSKSFVISGAAPVDGFISSYPNYGSTYVFEKPLVIQISTVGYGTQYITFFSSWDH